MAPNQDKKSGLMSHAIARLYKQRLEEVERELLIAQQSEPPTVDDRARDAMPVQFEDVLMPMEVIDDAAPLSKSKEEGTTDASSGEDTDVEDIQVEVVMPDHQYGDLSCEDFFLFQRLSANPGGVRVEHFCGWPTPVQEQSDPILADSHAGS
ncbi:uncharacterized protein LOC133391553 [Anopheles gambiae]|uniref:uncharacterized protein LOC133391553 n=1 Tax=Anopheles gambiae TaxID=7165 RepID=UPI002AC8B55D|nr:uncharacterized protein LOC133391553 [Anopheles gambiae]